MKRRSHWGWGLAERFLDRDARLAMGAHASELLGFEPGGIADPVPLEAITLRDPAMALPRALEAIGTADREERALHTHGKGYRDLVRGFRGDYSRAPDWVLVPETEEQISQVFEWCAGEKIALIPFGGGTSVVGGVERPEQGDHRGAVSLDLRRFSRVLQVDRTSLAAEIEAGATGPGLEAQLGAQGLTLRHFPQSFEFSTLGGWIATRAGGHYATLRTRIDDFVESARMITPAGVWASRRLPSSGAGPSPDRWVLGSEGILGVITSAWVRVVEKPRWRAKASVHFADFRAGAEGARRIVQAGLHPSNCRLLDPTEARLNAVTGSGKAVLLLGFESADHPLEPQLQRAIELALDAGGTLPEPARFSGPAPAERGGDAERWREAFFSGPYLQNVMVSLGVVADTFETACTWDRFEELHGGITAAVEDALRRVAGGGRVTCRLTHVYPDGPAPYFTFLAPARRGGELEQWSEIKSAASEAIARHGGTITHHHAVGRTHRPWYDRERPDPFALALLAAKRALDPHGILNPGVLVG